MQQYNQYTLLGGLFDLAVVIQSTHIDAEQRSAPGMGGAAQLRFKKDILALGAVINACNANNRLEMIGGPGGDGLDEIYGSMKQVLDSCL